MADATPTPDSIRTKLRNLYVTMRWVRKQSFPDVEDRLQALRMYERKLEADLAAIERPCWDNL
jgi:hypothetical protein